MLDDVNDSAGEDSRLACKGRREERGELRVGEQSLPLEIGMELN